MVVANAANWQVVEAWYLSFYRVVDAVFENTRPGFLFIVPQCGAIRLDRRVALFAQLLDHARRGRSCAQAGRGKSRLNAFMTPARIAAVWVLSGLALCPAASGAGPSSSRQSIPSNLRKKCLWAKTAAARTSGTTARSFAENYAHGHHDHPWQQTRVAEGPISPQAPATSQGTILYSTEGQRDGSIEVLEINEKTASVKVDNSGTVMEITFEKPSPTPPASTPRPQPYWPRLPMQAGVRSGGATRWIIASRRRCRAAGIDV